MYGVLPVTGATSTAWVADLIAPALPLGGEQVLGVIRDLERLVSGRRFRYGKKERYDRPSRIVEIRDVASFLIEPAPGEDSGARWLFMDDHSGGTSYVSLIPFRNHDRLDVGFGGPFTSEFPVDAVRELFARFSERLGAHHGRCSGVFSEAYAPHLADPYDRCDGPNHLRWPPPEGFPEYRLHVAESEGGPPEHAIPGLLRWINYWGKRTRTIVGFPPEERYRDCYVAAEELPNGACVFQLTEEPFDMKRPEHRRRLRRALEAFPEIGNRNPRSPFPKPQYPWNSPTSHDGSLFFFDLACPPLGDGEDDRPLRLVQAIEDYYAGLGASGEDLGGWDFQFLRSTRYEAPIDQCGRLLDRGALLTERIEGGFPTLTNRDWSAKHAVQGRFFEEPAPGYLYVRVFAQYVLPRWPMPQATRADELLERMAGLLSAYWGRALSYRDHVCTEQQVDNGDPRDLHPDFLPLLKPRAAMPDVYTPPTLGWINYWSDETCKRVGGPPGNDEDGEGPPLVRRAAHGGWIWKVTPDVLVLGQHDSHRTAFARAYARFPAVGGQRQG